MHDEIQKLRLEAGLSVPMVAKALGVSASTVYAWEDPKQANPPRPETLGAFLLLVRADDDQIEHLLRMRAGLPVTLSAQTAAGSKVAV